MNAPERPAHRHRNKRAARRREVPAGRANRDGARFDDPDRLDLTRRAGPVAFGRGIHHCLGALPARLEGQVALGKLVTRFPDLRLDAAPDELTWRFSLLMRGLETLPVRLG